MGRRGISLIEILVVIVILGVIAAILFPVLTAAHRSAKTGASMTHLKQAWTAISLYREDQAGHAQYGHGSEMGLPPHETYWEMMEDLGLKDTKGNPFYYHPCYPSRHEDSFLRLWQRHLDDCEGRAVMLGDYSMNEHDAGSMHNRFMTTYGIGITLDGSTRIQRKRGLVHYPGWWKCE